MQTWVGSLLTSFRIEVSNIGDFARIVIRENQHNCLLLLLRYLLQRGVEFSALCRQQVRAILEGE